MWFLSSIIGLYKQLYLLAASDIESKSREYVLVFVFIYLILASLIESSVSSFHPVLQFFSFYFKRYLNDCIIIMLKLT